jgi:hypothetical protein
MGTLKNMLQMICGRESLFMGAQMGNQEWESSNGKFERWLKGAVVVLRIFPPPPSLLGSSVKGTCKTVPLLETLEIGRKGSGDGHLFP